MSLPSPKGVYVTVDVMLLFMHAASPNCRLSLACWTCSISTVLTPAALAACSDASRNRLAAEIRTRIGCAATMRLSPSCAASAHSRVSAARASVGSTLSSSVPSGRILNKRVKQGITNFLHQITGTCVTHKWRARVTTDNGARQGCGNVNALVSCLVDVHAFVVTTKHQQRARLMNGVTNLLVIGLTPALREKWKAQGNPTRPRESDVVLAYKSRLPPHQNWLCQKSPGSPSATDPRQA